MLQTEEGEEQVGGGRRRKRDTQRRQQSNEEEDGRWDRGEISPEFVWLMLHESVFRQNEEQVT